MVSPPKPWERGTVASASPSPSVVTTSSSTAVPSSASSEPGSVTDHNGSTPPSRPPALSNPPQTSTSPYSTSSSPYNRLQSTYSPYGGYGSGGYGSMYGGGMYGGSMYGGMGMGYGMNNMGYGMGGMYGGGYGMPGMPMDPNHPSLTQQLESTTQHTFALLHSIVQTFTGLAQMIESTFMATHSSFFAMVGLVDQFSHLRNALGSVLGLFGFIRWLKELLTGKRNANPMQHEFRSFVVGKPVQGAASQQTPKPSKKPIIIFLLAIFGVPYAMHRLIKVLSQRMPPQSALQGPGGTPLDPSQLQFARAKYAFSAASPVELSLKENEIVAVMGKLDPATGMEVDPRTEVTTDWWKGRTRDGREGWFPSKWVEVLERKKQEPQVAPPAPPKAVE